VSWARRVRHWELRPTPTHRRFTTQLTRVSDQYVSRGMRMCDQSFAIHTVVIRARMDSSFQTPVDNTHCQAGRYCTLCRPIFVRYWRRGRRLRTININWHICVRAKQKCLIAGYSRGRVISQENLKNPAYLQSGNNSPKPLSRDRLGGGQHP